MGGFALGAVVLIVAIGAALVTLDATDRLKAPAFANRLSFDEKLRHLREAPIEAPEVLFVGSSTTLHGVDGAVLKETLGIQGDVANVAVQDLRINQTRFLADFFLSRYDGVEQIIMVSTMLDFLDCQTTETAFFDPEHVEGYLEGRLPDLYYHYKYLDIEGVLKRAQNIQHLRQADDELEALAFDPYGSLLLEVPRENVSDLVYEGRPIILDPVCYQELEAFAEELRDAGIQFVYVIAPMRPGYLELRDPDGSLLARHRQLVADHLEGTDALVIDAHEALDMPEEAFFDAYHLHRPKAKELTRFVGEKVYAALHGPGEREEVAGPTAARVERAQPSAHGGPGGS